MNALALMAALQVASGQHLCWMAPLPNDGARTAVAVDVVRVEPLPTMEPGAWIKTQRFPGIQFHVLAKDLEPCASAAAVHAGARQAASPPMSPEPAQVAAGPDR